MSRTADLWEPEREYRDRGFTVICGIDEAGRGPLAGDVYAAAVILPFGERIDGLDDSKKLTARKRDLLYEVITERAEAWAVATASVDEIERLNILNAAMLAMSRACDALKTAPQLALVDGNRLPRLQCRGEALVGGDGRSASVAAASVLAKVLRDRYMLELDAIYPVYGFAKHKGYGTAEHYAALKEYGPCPEHRRDFIRKLH